MGPPIQKLDKSIIFKVHRFFLNRKADRESNEHKMDMNINKLVAEATGVSPRTVMRIVSEGRTSEQSTGKVKFSAPIKPKEIKKKIIIQDIHIEVLQNKIHEYCSTHNKMPSIRKLNATLKEDGIINCSDTYLRNLLNQMGYTLGKGKSKDTVPVEITPDVEMRRNADSKAGDSDSDSSNIASGFPGATAEIDSSGEHSDFDDELAGAGGEDPTLDDLQKKWKHLRDYYIREQKKDNLKSGSAAKKRYTSYFQMLSFLDITIEHRNTASSHTLPEDENSTTSCDSLPPTTSPPPLPSNSLSKLSKSKSKIKKLSPFQKSILNRISVKEENDPDKHFLLSLLPDMKMMTDSEKFDFKFEIMTAIKRIKYSKPNPSSSTPSTKEYQIEVDQNELNYDVCKVETVEHSFSEPDPVSFVPATTDSLPEVNMFAVVQYISNNEKALKLLDYPKLKLLTKNNPNLITSIKVLQTESTYRVRGTVNFDRMTSHMCEIEYDTHTDTITSSECVCGSNPCEHTAAFVMFLSHKPTNKRTERLQLNKSKEGDSRSRPSGDDDVGPSTSTSIQIKVEEETEPSAKRQRVSQEPEVPVEPEPEITVVPLPKDENEPRKSKIECTFSRKSIYALWNYFPGSFPERTKKIQTTLKKKLHDDDYITDLAPLEQRIEHLCVFFDKMEYKSNKAEFTKYVNIKEVVLLERMSRNKNSSYIDPLS